MRDDYYPEIRPYVYAVGEMALLAGEVEVQLYDMARLLGIEAAERFTVGRLIPQLKTARWTVELAAWSDVDRRELEIWLDRVNTAMEGRNGILHSSKIWETAEDGAKIRSRTVHRDGTVRPEDIRKVEKITDRLAATRERAIPFTPTLPVTAVNPFGELFLSANGVEAIELIHHRDTHAYRGERSRHRQGLISPVRSIVLPRRSSSRCDGAQPMLSQAVSARRSPLTRLDGKERVTRIELA